MLLFLHFSEKDIDLMEIVLPFLTKRIFARSSVFNLEITPIAQPGQLLNYITLTLNELHIYKLRHLKEATISLRDSLQIL